MDSIQRQREYYDKRWPQERFANSLQAARCAAIVGALSSIDVKEPRILDFGCGSGWLSCILSQFGPTTAVDLSDYAIREASKKFPWVRFFQGNILEWNETSKLGEFDVIVSQEVIEHVSDQDQYLRIAHTLLKGGGYLLLTTPNTQTFAAMSDEMRQSWSDQPFEEIPPIPKLKSFLKKYFEIREMTTIIPGCGVKGLYRIASSYKLRRWLEMVGLGRIFESASLRAGFGLHVFVIARKRQ
jgi:cyclopropane fatty-acyl-phospholipid synthase-like methyltransferase